MADGEYRFDDYRHQHDCIRQRWHACWQRVRASVSKRGRIRCGHKFKRGRLGRYHAGRWLADLPERYSSALELSPGIKYKPRLRQASAFERARGTWASKSAVLAGDYLHYQRFYGYFDSSGQRQGGEVLWQTTGNYSTSSAPTVFRLKTSHVNSVTPNERLVLGGSLTLVDNTLTNLFSVTFAAADQKVVGGEIHMLITAKQVSGSIQTQVYRRTVTFVFGHNGATNSSAVDIRRDSGTGNNQVASSGGFSALQHAINSGTVVDIDTAITTGTLADTLTYKVLFNSDLTTISQFTCYYHIIYHGEADIVLA